MKKKFVFLAAGAILIILAVWGFMAGRKELAEEREREKPVKMPSRVVADEDGPTLVFDADTQKRADIAVAPIQTVARQQEIEVLVTVLSAQDLSDLRNAYIAAKSQVDKSRAALDASREERQRVTALHGDEQNVSTKTLETAQAQWQADESATNSAVEALYAVERSARQKWGSALTAAVASDAPLFRRLAEQQEVLLRIAAPAGIAMEPPAKTRIAANDGSFRTAMLISVSPQVDARTQGSSFFYIAPANGLPPGSSLTGYLATGAEQAGSIVPVSAVVSWQGKDWIYLQSTPERFVRRELPSAMSISQGWFVRGTFKEAHLVVRGAQTLLSEELRAQIQVGEDNE